MLLVLGILFVLVAVELIRRAGFDLIGALADGLTLPPSPPVYVLMPGAAAAVQVLPEVPA